LSRVGDSRPRTARRWLLAGARWRSPAQAAAAGFQIGPQIDRAAPEDGADRMGGDDGVAAAADIRLIRCE